MSNVSGLQVKSVGTTWRSLTLREGWTDFVRRNPVPRPDCLTMPQLLELPPRDRAVYNDARNMHHANFGPFLTPVMQEIMNDVVDLVADNSESRVATAKPGAVIDGYGGLGKTTILTAIGRKIELDARAGFGWNVRTNLGEEFVPVVYLTLTEGITVKQVNEALATFYGTPVPAKATGEQIGRIFVSHAERCGTRAILIDDIHNLRLRDTAGKQVNAHLKHLTNILPVTLVAAGIDTDASGLLSEGLAGARITSSQTRRRYTVHRVTPFDITTEGGRDTWISLVASVEDELLLANMEPGMLTSLSPYLHERTQGYIGPLMSLIRRAARRSIRTGTEGIDRNALDAILLDAGSEAERPKPVRTRPTRGRPGTRKVSA